MMDMLHMWEMGRMANIIKTVSRVINEMFLILSIDDEDTLNH